MDRQSEHHTLQCFPWLCAKMIGLLWMFSADHSFFSSGAEVALPLCTLKFPDIGLQPMQLAPRFQGTDW